MDEDYTNEPASPLSQEWTEANRRIREKVRLAPSKNPKHFVVFWERIANSGYCFVDAETAVEAAKKSGYPTKFCRLTVIEVVTTGEAYIEGTCG